MDRGSSNLRYNISVNSRKVNLEEFSGKIDKLLTHFDIRKGDYTGKYNISGLFINMVNDTYKNVFGNNNPNDLAEKEWNLIDVNIVRDILKNKFGKKANKYAPTILYREMRDFILAILLEIEKRGLTSK